MKLLFDEIDRFKWNFYHDVVINGKIIQQHDKIYCFILIGIIYI